MKPASSGCISGGTKRNAESVADVTTYDDALDATTRLILADAQTSGGLLLCVKPAALDTLLGALRDHATLAAAVIGTVLKGAPGAIRVQA